MTRHVVDIASYQGGLRPADVRRAGFTAVNVKISHGLGTRSVHPDAAAWVRGPSGLGVSTFHFLTGDASGFAQARYVWQRMQDLGVPDTAAHQCDTEADAPWETIWDYVTAMRQLLGRPVALYTGRWWWESPGRGWDASGLSPYLWAAPNAGYGTGYPGDRSAAWAAGYAGHRTLSVLQYAVGPLRFPDGTRGTIDVSMSAIRDDAVWADLTTRRTGMTVAPDAIKAERRLWLDTIPGLDPLAVGIVGDDNHNRSGSSYHLGEDALRPDSYTITESSRDRNGLSEDAAAIDVGYWEVTVGGVKHTLYTHNRWLVRECEANAPDTRDIREVIYTLDGKTVRRWDRLGKRSTGDSSHLSHTHKSYFRDSTRTDKTALTRRYFQEIGLLEDPDMTPEQMTAWAKSTDGRDALAAAVASAKYGTASTAKRWPETPNNTAINYLMLAAMHSYDNAAALAALGPAVARILANVTADDTEAQQILAAIEQARERTVAGVLDGLTAPDQSDQEIGAALAAVFGDRAPGVAEALRVAAGGR